MAKSIKLLLLCTTLLLMVAVQGQAFSNQTNPTIKGKIIETMDAGGYTYLHLDSNGTKTWAAIPVTKITVGEVVELNSGMVMQNFTSKTLGRTFHAIVFSSGIAKR